MPLTPKIQDTNDALEHLPQLANTISNCLQTPAGWIALTVFIFWMLITKDFSHIFNIVGRKEKEKIEHLDLYVTKPELADSESIRVLRDLRDAHYFKVATGIYAEKKLRNALINLHEQTSYLINWRQIRRAWLYFEVDKDERIAVREPTFFEFFEYWCNQISGYVLFLAAAGMFSLFVLIEERTLSTVLSYFGGLIVFILLAMFAFAQNWSFNAAKSIRSEIKNSKKLNIIEPT